MNGKVVIRFLFILLLIYVGTAYLLDKQRESDLISNNKSIVKIKQEFKFHYLDKGEFTNNNIEGKDIVLYFFSPECSECNKMSPKICELAKSYPDIQFLMVSNESKDLLLRYSKKMLCSYLKILVDDQNISTIKFSIYSVPTIVIFKKGNLKERIVGNVKLSFIEEKIRK
jgi:thiol-disulfide isomerase/thioredoxin